MSTLDASLQTERPSCTLPWDWYKGAIPDNVFVDETAYIETTYSFSLYRSELSDGVRIGRGSSTYLGTMFDVGPKAQVIIGDFCLIHGAWFMCDSLIEIGPHALISWNVVFMDSYGVWFDPAARRRQLENVPRTAARRLERCGAAKPIRVGPTVWIGFDCIVMAGVTIGEGSIIGARSVVTADVPPFSIAAGNPARVIRKI
jgi:acetyltransferase-like isoleucine patch superfamily enzyme